MWFRSNPERDTESIEIGAPARVTSNDGSGVFIQEVICELFDRFVSDDGMRVNYDGLLASDEFRIYEQASLELAGFDPLTLEPREERLAFWINLYNMAALQAVGSFGGVSGIDGVNGFFERRACNLGGLDYSFNDIEYGILRGNARRPNRAWRYWRNWDRRLQAILKPPEPRVCFTLTRASRSGPALRFYDSALIEGQLYKAVLGFVSNGGVIIDREQDFLSLSQIFRDYSADFGGGQGVIRFIADHLPTEDAAWVRSRAGRMNIKFHSFSPEMNAKP
ncbi:MAG: DUF547 domain-containing protein [Actinobacteria bacterium]|nr:DUF547 domain-containing protein [Actinomycetota bacterium]